MSLDGSETMMSRFDKWKETLGFTRKSDVVLKRMNYQNLNMGFPIVVLGFIFTVAGLSYACAELARRVVAHETIETYFFQKIFIYLMVIVTSIWMMLEYRHMKLHHERSQRRLTFINYSYVLAMMCYGFQLSITYMDNGIPFSPFLIACMWSFLLFNINPIFTVVVSFVFNECIRLGAMRHGVKVEIYSTLIFMISLWIVSIVRYEMSLKNARLMVEAELLNEKLQNVNERLSHISTTDELTGVKNRIGLRNDFDSFIGKKLFVLFCDIDNFKYINDNFGHPIGDRVIANYAETLVMVYGLDGVYRYGGDEFLVIKEYDEDTARVYMKRFKTLFSRFCVPETTHLVTTSGGYYVDECPDADTLRHMFKVADDNLYSAKQNGKNRVVGTGGIS